MKKKKGPGVAKTMGTKLDYFDKRIVDVAKFKPDLSSKKLAGIFGRPGRFELSFLTIDTLSVTKTVGLGRTNLTFIRPTIVQADAATPFASFDRTLSPSRNPAISMHFEPKAYGITAVSNFLMAFAIECFGQTTFTLNGFPGSGTLANAGTKVLSGKITVTLGFNNVPPSQQTHGFLEQTAGAPWNFFSVRARFPFPILIQL
jgi:hypothetical protein